MTSPRSRRRWLRPLALAGALGIATHLPVIAWCVWMVRIPATSLGQLAYWADGERRFIVRLDQTAGKTIFRWEPEPPEGFGLVSGIGIAPTPPRWVDMSVDLQTPEAMQGRQGLYRSSPVRHEIAYGWPMLSFRGGVLDIQWHNPQLQHDYRPALPEFPPQPAIGAPEELRTIPLTPMWPGIAVNTLAYAAAWWVMLAITAAWRRRSRHRRGACPACGYDRRGIAANAPCPECGNEPSAQAEGQR